jgi:F-type H+-transporting ATPase subunit epsilon
MAGETEFNVKVLTPEGEVFDGEVTQVNTRTAHGEIGILANHTPMLARLRPAELRLHKGGSEVESYAQAEGWLEVFGNHVLVLVGEAIKPEDLDASDIKERISSAEKRLSEAEADSAAATQAELEKERYEAFLSVAEST